jgi:hypothetical protein
MALDELRSRVGWTKIVSVMVLCGALVALGAAPSSGIGVGLTGVWNATIVLDNGTTLCTTPGLLTADGGIVTQGCNVNVSPGYGQWRKIGHNRFAISFVGVNFTTPGDGEINSTYRVRATVRLSHDGQTFSGPFLTEIFSLDGTPLFSASGIVTSQRIGIEPL